MASLGRLLIVLGFAALAAGALLLLADRLGVHRIPGTLSWTRGNLRVFVPLGAMIVVSVVLTIVLNLLLRR